MELVVCSTKNLRFEIDTASDVPRFLVGDSLRLGQVLINLLGNAVKFTEVGEISAQIPLKSDFGDTVVYRAAEAQLLVGLPPEEVRAYHEVKVYFDGIIERATPNEPQIDAAKLLGTEEGPE